MRDAVRAAFVAFTERFEGKVPWMYLDVKGLVTVAIGNLIDPMPTALGLPFLRSDGTPATSAEIAVAWRAVKARTDLKLNGGGAFAGVTSLRLNDEGIAQVVISKRNLNEAILSARFRDFESWPADAQLGLLSMAWAAGAMFDFPKFKTAAIAQDWATCADQCHMNDAQNPGLRPRNAANRALFLTAAAVKQLGADPSVVYYPGQPTATCEAP